MLQEEEQSFTNVTFNRIYALSDRNKKEAVTSTVTASTTAVVGTTLVTVFVTGALSQVWSLLNGMQIFIHFPLLLSFPQYSKLLTDAFIKIATFDIVTTITLNKYQEVDIFKLFLDVPPETEDEELVH